MTWWSAACASIIETPRARRRDQFSSVVLRYEEGDPRVREALLVRTFAELADTLVDDFDVVELLTLLADRCVEVLDVEAAGLMLASIEGELRVVASSSDAMRLLELFELQTQEGPCFECFHTGRAVLHERLVRGSERWPQFGPRALDAGFQSVQALPMRLRGQTVGALNLFRRDAAELNEADVVAAQAFADVATIAILQHRAAAEAQAINEQLTNALNSRIVIEQAKGMVAERAQLNMEQSFSRMRSHARNHNLRLADLAASIIEGTTPATSLDPLSRAAKN
jgi:GAF domain-containing protein